MELEACNSWILVIHGFVYYMYHHVNDRQIKQERKIVIVVEKDS